MNKRLASPSSAEEARAARRREIENTLLTQALCGWPVSSAVYAQLSRYEAGELYL